MKKQILTLAVLSATSLTFLTACGSSPSADAGAMAMPEIRAARLSSLRIVGNFNNGGTTDGTEASENDNTYDYNYSETQETLALRVGNNNTIIMIVNGVETTLAREDGNNDRWQASNGINTYVTDYTSFSANDDNNLLDVLTGADEVIHGTHVLYSTDPNNYDSGESSFDSNDTFGFATVGIETPAPVVANQTATATYGGRIDLRTRPQRVTSLDDLSRETYYGDLTMNVDFDANTIAGTAELAKYDEDTEETVVVGMATLASAPIIGNGFEGDFTLGGALRTDIGLTDNPTGNYSGNFFGPNAADLSGVLRLKGTNANGVVFGYGGFSADRRDN